MKAYKVVFLSDDGVYQSAFELGDTLDYCIGKCTVPHTGCGPMGIFIDKRDALQWFNQHFVVGYSWKLFECDAKISKTKRFYNRNSDMGFVRCSVVTSGSGINIPRGTEFADEVTLIREIELGEKS